ncbi:uncharacterized protein [Nicotiana sylvestris]|uniref:uncharacterized protein n=1 Tax=Nicotiana sylvestris TaxID=4096 RepID=UPI00388CB141
MEGTEHNQALYLTVKCEDSVVTRALVDNGSTANICPLSTLNKLKVGNKRIHKNNICVRGFDGGGKDSVRDIVLELTIGPVEFTMEFQVLDVAVSYNMLLGRPWIHAAKAVPSTLHQMFKFEWDRQEIVVHGEDNLCVPNDAIIPFIEFEDDKGQRVYQVFDTVAVEKVLEGKCVPTPRVAAASVMVAVEMPGTRKRPVTAVPILVVYVDEDLMERFKRIFADVNVLEAGEDRDESTLADHLDENPVNEEYEPLKTYFPGEEVMHIDELEQIEWPGWKLFFDGAANMKGIGIGAVLVSEPGHHYSVTAQLRFYHCFAGYHQIWMDEEDVEKIAFITPWGVYFYKIMPFGLKNAGATYMRAITTIFHDMIHKEIKVYVDDVIIKSKRASNHIEDLTKFFDRIRRYNLKLNPAKCALGVPVGKLLGFIVIRRGIELDPSKVKAIQELPPPKSKKDGIDVIGPIEPTASNGYRFILVAIDYFRKWVKDASYKAVTKKVVADFVKDGIVCRFGVPESITTDNATNINNDLMKDMCETFKIKHKNSIAYRP